MCTLPNRKFRLVGNPDNYRQLWENRESLDKYLAILKEFWDEEKQQWKPENNNHSHFPPLLKKTSRGSK